MEVQHFSVCVLTTLLVLTYPIAARDSNQAEEESNTKFKRQFGGFEPCESDSTWVAHGDKCYKVMRALATAEEAVQLCGQYTSGDHISPIVSIKSAEEQDFLTKYIFENSHVDTTVWLGARRSSVSYIFDWDDKTHHSDQLQYGNFEPGAPSSDTHQKCLQMGSSGQWRDVSCDIKNVVVCQKFRGEIGNHLDGSGDINELLQKLGQHMADIDNKVVKCTKEHSDMENKVDRSYRDMLDLEKKVGAGGRAGGGGKNNHNSGQNVQDALDDLSKLERKINAASRDVDDLRGNPGSAPIGSMYVQLPKQKEPSAIWSQIRWREVTADYGGLFFRAEGSGSKAFGIDQEADLPRIYYIQTGTFNVTLEEHATVRIGKYNSGAVFTGGDNGTKIGLTMLMNANENRPKNTAIRIWTRTK